MRDLFERWAPEHQARFHRFFGASGASGATASENSRNFDWLHDGEHVAPGRLMGASGATARRTLIGGAAPVAPALGLRATDLEGEKPSHDTEDSTPLHPTHLMHRDSGSTMPLPACDPLEVGRPAAVLFRETVMGDVWVVADESVLSDIPEIATSDVPTLTFAEVPHLTHVDVAGFRALAACKRVIPNARVVQ